MLNGVATLQALKYFVTLGRFSLMLMSASTLVTSQIRLQFLQTLPERGCGRDDGPLVTSYL